MLNPYGVKRITKNAPCALKSVLRRNEYKFNGRELEFVTLI